MEDKSRVIDDIVLNEMDYFHDNIDKLRASKSQLIKEIKSIQEMQNDVENRMEAKFRNFELKERKTLSKYVKSTIDKEVHTKILSKKERNRRTRSTEEDSYWKKLKNVKSSGYGYRSRLTGVELRESDVEGKKECSEKIRSQKEVQTDLEIAQISGQSGVDHVAGVSGHGSFSCCDETITKNQSCQTTPLQLVEVHEKEIEKPTLAIVNDKVTRRNVPTEKNTRQKIQGKSSYLVKNPRERIHPFRCLPFCLTL